MNSWETEWFERRSQITPNNTAIVDKQTGVSWTYRQVHDRVERLAAAMQHWGIIKGDRVALLAPNGLCYIELLFACSRVGAILVPLNWRLSTLELTYILEDCSYRIVFYSEELEALVADVHLDRRICLQSESYLEACACDQTAIVDQTREARDPLLMIYTGGTTGKPKGVVLSHRSIYANAANTIISWGLTEKDITITFLPMFHTGGINALSLPVLLAGGCVIVEREFEAVGAVHLLESSRCTVVLMVPTMYHLLIQTKSFSESAFSHMRAFISGGALAHLRSMMHLRLKSYRSKKVTG
nr:AMP-binding protein [Paenibacillus sp. N3.4]